MYRISENLKRRRAAKEVRDKRAKLIPDQEDIWQVESSTETYVKYSVQLIKDSCDSKIKCTTCGACLHMYVCSCIDYAVHYTVCKHTHLVHSLKGDEGSASNDQDLLDTLVELENVTADDSTVGVLATMKVCQL